MPLQYFLSFLQLHKQSLFWQDRQPSLIKEHFPRIIPFQCQNSCCNSKIYDIFVITDRHCGCNGSLKFFTFCPLRQKWKIKKKYFISHEFMFRYYLFLFSIFSIPQYHLSAFLDFALFFYFILT